MQDLIDAEMEEYSDGAYADHGCARDQLRRFAEAVAKREREACAKICEEHAADTSPPYKPHEDNYLDYLDGWLDASNECGWAIRERSN